MKKTGRVHFINPDTTSSNWYKSQYEIIKIYSNLKKYVEKGKTFKMPHFPNYLSKHFKK